MNTLILTISDISIRQDDEGRYCLNDLHKAAGNENKHRPGFWLKTQQAFELILEVENSTKGIPALEQKQAVTVINGGNNRGTYVVKELVYAYAMWISPKFHLAVIRAYDALVTQPTALPDGPLTLDQFKAAQQTLAAAQKRLNSVQVIVSAADLLGLKAKKRQTNTIAPRPWTPEEEEAACQMQAEGYSAATIAKQLGNRTTHAVRNHFRYMAKKQGGAA